MKIHFKTALILGCALLLSLGYAARNLYGEDTEQPADSQASADYVGPDRCLMCHAAMKDKWSGNPHRATTEEMTDPSLKACEACHEAGGRHAREGGKKNLIFNPAGAEKIKVAEICLKCHGDQASGAPKEWRKLRGADWKRSTHYRKGILCANCHAVHGGNDSLLAKPPEALCQSCHSVVSGGEYTHSPVKQGMCLECHNPHGEGPARMVRRNVEKVCEKCHDVSKSETVKKHSGFNVAGKNCVSCHNPHSKNKAAKLLRQQAHAPFKGGKCAMCHKGEGQADPLALKEDGGKLCAACHGDKVAEFDKSAVPHFPVKEGLCVSCHNPHVSDGKTLLKDRMDNLCATCHRRVDDQLSGVQEHPPVKTGECLNCHSPHGGERERFLKQEPNELCKKCHNKIAFSHPLVEQDKNPALGPIIRCYTCHSVHGADISKLLPMPETELCNQCHRKNIVAPVEKEEEEDSQW